MRTQRRFCLLLLSVVLVSGGAASQEGDRKFTFEVG